jgi:predicted RNase H-like HicB family nuclease
MKTFTAYIEWDKDTKLYVGSIPSVPGAYTQGESLDELHENLKEVLEMCLEEMDESGEPLDFPDFVGLQQIEVGV